jgi:hypothetical protein
MISEHKGTKIMLLLSAAFERSSAERTDKKDEKRIKDFRNRGLCNGMYVYSDFISFPLASTHHTHTTTHEGGPLLTIELDEWSERPHPSFSVCCSLFARQGGNL